MRIATLALGLAVPLGLALTAASGADEKKAAKKKLLVITESKGFVHPVVKRPKADEFCLVEKVLTELGKKSGDFEATCTQDSRAAITAENLKDYDAVFFYTTGELPLSDTQKADLLSFVKNGKGFTGSHCATDTFYKWPEYGEMIGGYFDQHPWNEGSKVQAVIDDKTHPATKHLGDRWELTDEIYQFKVPYDRSKMRVLMRLEPAWAEGQREAELKRIDDQKKKLLADAEKLAADGKQKEADDLKKRAEGLKPAIHRTDKDFALSWVKDYGKGRVFYTALGHRPDMWES